MLAVGADPATGGAVPVTLKVAIPNKASSGPSPPDAARGRLPAVGRCPRTARTRPGQRRRFFFLRPKDIATYVGQGTLDLGITGRDMLVDSGAPAAEVVELGFGHSTFRLAAQNSVDSVAGKRIATSYPGLLRDWLERTGTDATVVRLDGAVENAVQLGVADAVADVVDTGNTLRQAGLVVLGDPLLRSQALLVRPAHTGPMPPRDVRPQAAGGHRRPRLCDGRLRHRRGASGRGHLGSRPVWNRPRCPR